MTYLHARRSHEGPTWRDHAAADPLPNAWTFVGCRCGVDMQFEWPPHRSVVRCFGCGAHFPRPDHLPDPLTLGPWRPRVRRHSLTSRLRALPRGVQLALVLCLLAAILLGFGLGFAVRP